MWSSLKGAKIQKKAAPDLPEANLDVSPPVISDTSYQSTDGVGDRRDPEKGVPGGLQDQVASSFPPQLGVDLLDSTGLDPADNVERERQEQAATKAQAAFRGYLVIFHCFSCCHIVVKSTCQKWFWAFYFSSKNTLNFSFYCELRACQDIFFSTCTIKRFHHILLLSVCCPWLHFPFNYYRIKFDYGVHCCPMHWMVNVSY